MQEENADYTPSVTKTAEVEAVGMLWRYRAGRAALILTPADRPEMRIATPWGMVPGVAAPPNHIESVTDALVVSYIEGAKGRLLKAVEGR